jgi:hypothetical protein
VLARVLDEFGHQGEDESIIGYQFRFQNGMVIGGVSVVCHRQAMRTMALREGEHTCAVNSDEEVATTQAIAVEHFLANQGFDGPGDHGLHLWDVQAFVSLIEGIAVRARVDVEQSLKLGR